MQPSCIRGFVLAAACALLLSSVPPVTSQGPVPQDDAGSGQDAPDAISQAITIQPDTVYDGLSPGPLVDNYDVYHLSGQAGQAFRGWSDGNLGCYYLLDAQGAEVGHACSYEHAPVNTGPIVATLPATGDYYLKVVHLAPATYRFAYSLAGEPPEVRAVAPLLVEGGAGGNATAWPMPAGCDGDFVYVAGTVGDIPKFTDGCYHMRTGLNRLDTPEIDVLLVPPASPYPERDLRTMRQAVEMWADGIATLAPAMDLDWLSDGVDFDLFVDDDALSLDPLWDPEIVVLASNPVGGAGIGIDPVEAVFGGSGPCHGQPNPLASLEDWQALPGFDGHHGGLGGTFSVQCEGGGSLCFAVNGAIDPAPGVLDVFGLYDLVAHEFGHCLTVGHVGDAMDHEAEAVPYADIMSYTNQEHDKCVSTLDVESFALTMSRFLLATPLRANDGLNPEGPFQVQDPDDHRYASSTGLASDCGQPDAGLVPGGGPETPAQDDDADSGQDAPESFAGAIALEPDVVYRGSSVGPVVDSSDIYLLSGQAGQVLRAWSDGNLGCYYLVDAQNVELARGCSYGHAPINTGPLQATLPATGDYYLRIAHLAPAVYHVAFALDADPPSVGLLDQL